MDLEDLTDLAELAELVSGNHPVGLGGCRTRGTPFDICEYNLTVFDGAGLADSILLHNGANLRIHHGSLKDSDSEKLIHYHNMKILRDESWDLQTFLANLKQKWTLIYRDYARECLLSSVFCSRKAETEPNPLAQCWVKSASAYLANALLGLHMVYPSPAHSLDMLRRLEKHEAVGALIHDVLGINRATPSLLDRMTKSTMGLSDIVEANGHSAIIRAKSDYMVRNSMLADCYMYLIQTNRVNLSSIKNPFDRPDIAYILRIAFDLDSDAQKTVHDAQAVCDTSLEMLSRD